MTRLLRSLAKLAICSAAFLCTLSAQHTSYKCESVRLNDSTNYVDLPRFGLRIVYTRPDSTWDDPNAHEFLGSHNLSLTRDTLYLSLSTRQAVKAVWDYSDARRQRHEGSGDDPIVPSVVDYRQMIKEFRNNTTGAWFREFVTLNNRKFAVRLEDGETLSGYLVRFITFIDDLQVTLNSFYGLWSDNYSRPLAEAVAKEYPGNSNKSSEVFHQRLYTMLRDRSLRTARMVRIDKIR